MQRPASVFASSATFIICASAARADLQPAVMLPFSQDWSNIALISTDDDWSGVAGIIGYRGDDLVCAVPPCSTSGVDPQTVVIDGSATPVDVNANELTPNTFSTGGIAEFEIANPTIALNGSGTADAPHIVIGNINTTGLSNITVAYNLVDLDGSADNSIQPVALQFRVGTSGDFTNVPAGFVADASAGPDLAGQVTPVSAVLPPEASNQALIQIRIITTNALGNDEWIGIDDISITAGPKGDCPANIVTSGSSATQVDVDDLLAVITSWGPCPAPPATCPANIVTAGSSATQVDVDDLLAVITSWGPCP